MERLKKLKNMVDGERVILRGYRVTIPKRIRDKFGLKDGSVLQIGTEDERIVLEIIRT